MPTDTITAEQWKPVTDFPAYEVSNAWRFRKISNGKVPPTKGHGGNTMVELVDRKGRRHLKSVRRLGQSHWGHQCDVVPDDALRTRERTPVRELANPISHQPVTFTKITPEEASRLLDRGKTASLKNLSGEADFVSRPHYGEERVSDVDADLGLRVRYRDVVWPGVREGYYQVSDLGEVFNAEGAVLTPLSKKYGSPKVSLMRSDRPGYAQVRIDYLVCTAFHGPRPSDKHGPCHINGDITDYRADNLCWKEGYAGRRYPTKKEEPMDIIKAEQHAAALTGVSITEPGEIALSVSEALTPDISAEVEVITTTLYRYGKVTASVDTDRTAVAIDIDDTLSFALPLQAVDDLVKVLSAIS